ncbi:MAG: hypothetical protein EOP76_08355 [Variovorax sp.]|nr:MAG: hypothetical protein EOP76_08355 [Variovorax sp.]
MTAKPFDHPRTGTDGLAEALAKNQEATNAVQGVADELGVVHAVLTQEVAKLVGKGDAADAVERTAALETKLIETAEKMVEVNHALSDQRASMKHLTNAKQEAGSV